jgi:hypothetical protein
MRNPIEPVVQLPFRGEWKSIKSPNHHIYAFDFCKISMATNKLSSSSVASYFFSSVPVNAFYSWDQDVYAPFDGEVIAACNEETDRERINFLKDTLKMILARPRITDKNVHKYAGNYLLIESKHKDYVGFIAHLQEGSVNVTVGNHVTKGQVIGKVGNSGYSLFPHIHFQVMDGPDLLHSKVIDFDVEQFQRLNGLEWTTFQQGKIYKSEIIKI